jgi:hypothetical protein
MAKFKFECIKGLADDENLNVIVMQGDTVELVDHEDGEICVEGIKGWCSAQELFFTPSQFVIHFKSIN